MLRLCEQGRRGSMYLEEERSEVISCIFSLKEEVGALAKALRLFEVSITQRKSTVESIWSFLWRLWIGSFTWHDSCFSDLAVN